jgi:hypothetical protein
MVTPPKPSTRAITRAEFEQLKLAVEEARSDAAKAARGAAETHDKVSDMHKALMMPSPGQEKSLLDRMAIVTINVESGGRVAAMTVKLAGLLAAIGAVWAIITAVGSPK